MTVGKAGAGMLAATVAVALAITMLFATGAGAAVSTKLLWSGQFGLEVDKTTKGDICNQHLVEIGDVCGEGIAGEAAGAFKVDSSVATDPTTGDVYVGDVNNDRIEKFTATGEFLLTFGWNVNKTKINEGAPQAQRNVCAKPDECKAGEAGMGLAGQISVGQDVAVDPTTGNIYVLELFNKRIEEFNPTGEFVLMMGGNVNQTKVNEAGSTETGRNVCTAASHDICQKGEFMPSGPAHGAFREFVTQFSGGLMATGGPEHLLYVADEGRLQEFAASGEWKGEIPLTAISATAKPVAIAVDPAGDVYVAANSSDSPFGQIGGIHKLDAKGIPVPGFAESVAGKTEGSVRALAVDPATERLAATENVEAGPQGILYDSTGAVLSSFAPPVGMTSIQGITFNAKSELYLADDKRSDVEIFEPAPVPEPVTGTPPCKGVTTTGMTLSGQVNPEEVTEAKAWFEYWTAGNPAVKTLSQPVSGNVFVAVEAAIAGLLPNEIYNYRLAAEGKTDVGLPEFGETYSCVTLLAPANIEGKPESNNVTYSSVALFGQLNPENAETEYFFEYAPEPLSEYEGCEESSCPAATAPLRSSADGTINVALGLTDLQPSTTYHYRLVVVNRSKVGKEEHKSVGAEATFTTLSAPNPSASTLPASEVGVTSAQLNGEVDPDGAGATYTFQVGIYKGADTVYSPAVQGPAGAQAGNLPVSYTLTGLQPDTTYAYRVTVSSSYEKPENQPVQGEQVLLTTHGFPLVEPPQQTQMLPAPKIDFPKPTKPSLTTQQKLKNALKACRKKPARKRASCERAARKKYRVVKSKKSRKKK